MERYTVAGLSGMDPGAAGVGEFAARVGCGEEAAARVMEWWRDRGIGEREGDAYRYGAGQRLEAAVHLLRLGCHVQQVAAHLHWRDFEGLVARILESHAFEVRRNHIMTGPRMEMDVVGTRMGTALAIDCKHWSRTSPSAISGAVSRQVERARRYAAVYSVDTVPALVTLHEAQPYVRGTPVVPAHALDSFVEGFFGSLDAMNVIPAG